MKINNNDYKLLLVEPNHEKLLMDDGEYHSGVTDFIEKKIYIRNDLNVDSCRYTLLHELTHAFIDSYGFLQVDWNDEIVADFIANYIYNICETAHNITEELTNEQTRNRNSKIDNA